MQDLPETGRPNRIYFIPNEDPTEDNRYNVREGKLPRGKHEIGFKELSWNKKTLDEFK
jgi:hypothetical protein